MEADDWSSSLGKGKASLLVKKDVTLTALPIRHESDTYQFEYPETLFYCFNLPK